MMVNRVRVIYKIERLILYASNNNCLIILFCHLYYYERIIICMYYQTTSLREIQVLHICRV